MISTICPQEIRAASHKKQTAKWWADPEYRKIQESFLKENPVCNYCGQPSEVVHHDDPRSYNSKEEYYNPENMTPACHSCHRQYRRGLEVCPVCKEKGEIHYMIRGRDKCSKHNGGTIYIRRIGRVKALHHPCKNNHGTQVCIRDGRKFLCGRSWKNAERCDHFIKREKEEV